MSLPNEFIQTLRSLKEGAINWGALSIHAYPQILNHALLLIRLPETFGDDFAGYEGISPTIVLAALTENYSLPGKQMQVIEDERPYAPPVPYPTPKIRASQQTSISVTFREHYPKYLRGGSTPFGIANMSIRQIFDRWTSLVAAYNDRTFAPGGLPPIDVVGTALAVFLTPELNVNYAYYFRYIFPSNIGDIQNITPGRRFESVLTVSVTFRYFYPEIIYSPTIEGAPPPFSEIISQNLEKVLNE